MTDVIGPNAHYAGPSRGHAIAFVDAALLSLVLEDGSRWEGYEGYREVLQGWVPGEMITVKENRDLLYPYKLVNVHRNQSIEARISAS